MVAAPGIVLFDATFTASGLVFASEEPARGVSVIEAVAIFNGQLFAPLRLWQGNEDADGFAPFLIFASRELLEVVRERFEYLGARLIVAIRLQRVEARAHGDPAQMRPLALLFDEGDATIAIDRSEIIVPLTSPEIIVARSNVETAEIGSTAIAITPAKLQQNDIVLFLTSTLSLQESGVERSSEDRHESPGSSICIHFGAFVKTVEDMSFSIPPRNFEEDQHETTLRERAEECVRQSGKFSRESQIALRRFNFYCVLYSAVWRQETLELNYRYNERVSDDQFIENYATDCRAAWIADAAGSTCDLAFACRLAHGLSSARASARLPPIEVLDRAAGSTSPCTFEWHQEGSIELGLKKRIIKRTMLTQFDNEGSSSQPLSAVVEPVELVAEHAAEHAPEGGLLQFDKLFTTSGKGVPVVSDEMVRSILTDVEQRRHEVIGIAQLQVSTPVPNWYQATFFRNMVVEWHTACGRINSTLRNSAVLLSNLAASIKNVDETSQHLSGHLEEIVSVIRDAAHSGRGGVHGFGAPGGFASDASPSDERNRSRAEGMYEGAKASIRLLAANSEATTKQLNDALLKVATLEMDLKIEREKSQIRCDTLIDAQKDAHQEALARRMADANLIMENIANERDSLKKELDIMTSAARERERFYLENLELVQQAASRDADRLRKGWDFDLIAAKGREARFEQEIAEAQIAAIRREEQLRHQLHLEKEAELSNLQVSSLRAAREREDQLREQLHQEKMTELSIVRSDLLHAAKEREDQLRTQLHQEKLVELSKVQADVLDAARVREDQLRTQLYQEKLVELSRVRTDALDAARLREDQLRVQLNQEKLAELSKVQADALGAATEREDLLRVQHMREIMSRMSTLMTKTDLGYELALEHILLYLQILPVSVERCNKFSRLHTEMLQSGPHLLYSTHYATLTSAEAQAQSADTSQ